MLIIKDHLLKSFKENAYKCEEKYVKNKDIGKKIKHVVCSKVISSKPSQSTPDIFWKLDGSEFSVDNFTFMVPNEKDWFSGIKYDDYNKKMFDIEPPNNISIETKNVKTMNSSFSKSISPIEHGNAIIFDVGQKAVIDLTIDNNDKINHILIQQKNVKKK